MKSKFLKKLCVYAISVSMMLPATVPVTATTIPVIVRDYSYLHLEAINYSYVHLYEGDSLQLKTTMSSATLNKIPGKYKWASSNRQMVSVSSNGRITAKKGNSSKMTTVVLVKGTTAIAECEVVTFPRIKFSTATRTAKKGTTLKVCVPDYASNCKSSNKSVVKVDNRFWRDEYGYDKNGKHYFDLKCLKKGTSTITFTVRGNSSKNNYRLQKTFKFKVTVK